MEKIIVATDLSSASRSGMRYAIQRSQATSVRLEFLYVYQTLRASFWTDEEYAQVMEREEDAYRQELLQWIKMVYREMGCPLPNPLAYSVHHDLDPVNGIIDYAVRKKADYIYTSTAGAGGVKRWFGTTASKLIERSPIPLFCAPSSRPVKPVDQLLYASDMRDYVGELKQVATFAKPIGATIDLLHLYYPFEYLKSEDQFRSKLKKTVGYPVELYLKSRNIEETILEEIRTAIRRSRPSVLVLFTHQGRSFFDRILLPANAREYAFQATIPLLSFPKKGKSESKG